eukprot:CAMPEP_0178405376 /NCGR_PEP_ID=MMETSP0689_2-20121128/18366_1 /TAXON_ID=160604 /ORGANISM="Amphidinium massartii, Strain CS-259" /LENGTH=207 /DNA_ID=CAMNT_0020026387 /DNA_START=96 /DNA_END=719 /DNA_ORIENTATION=+
MRGLPDRHLGGSDGAFEEQLWEGQEDLAQEGLVEWFMDWSRQRQQRASADCHGSEQEFIMKELALVREDDVDFFDDSAHRHLHHEAQQSTWKSGDIVFYKSSERPSIASTAYDGRPSFLSSASPMSTMDSLAQSPKGIGPGPGPEHEVSVSLGAATAVKPKSFGRSGPKFQGHSPDESTSNDWELEFMMRGAVHSAAVEEKMQQQRH